jgi:hypothetical protein
MSCNVIDVISIYWENDTVKLNNNQTSRMKK